MDLWVLIYSKFSLKCQQLQAFIEENGLDIPFTMICIDDKDMRNRIMKSKDFNIKYVPTILQVNQLTGVVSQYEADKAFELLNGIVQSFVAEAEEQDRIIKDTQPPPQPIVQQPAAQHTDIQEIENETIIPLTKKDIIPLTKKESSHTLLEDIDTVIERESTLPAHPTAPMTDANPIKKRIRASDVIAQAEKENPKPVAMPSYNSAGIDLTSGPPPPIKSVKSGAPINISEVMARAAQSNESK